MFPDIRNTGMDSEEFCDFALNEASVALLPGTNFGKFGDGFVRLSCVSSMDAIEKAVSNLNSALRRKNESR